MIAILGTGKMGEALLRLSPGGTTPRNPADQCRGNS
jgi:hypothetical protein